MYKRMDNAHPDRLYMTAQTPAANRSHVVHDTDPVRP